MKIQLRMAATAAALLLAAAMLPANAAPITYTLSGVTASFTFPTSAVVTLTGNFTFDPATDILTNPDITQTTTPSSADLFSTNPESFPTVETAASNLIAVISANDFDAMNITFTTALSSAPTPVSEVLIASTLSFCESNCFSASVTGAAIPTSEPAGLALLGGALGLFLLMRWGGKPASPPTCPDRPAGV